MRQFIINQRVVQNGRKGTLISIDPSSKLPYKVKFDDNSVEFLSNETLRPIEHLEWNDHKELESK